MTASPLQAPVRGVLFDVDGTLYRARPLRIRATAALALLALDGPRRARRTWGGLYCYRRVLEEIRHAPRSAVPLAEAHLQRAADLAHLDPDELRADVDEWFVRRPLAWIGRCKRDGVDDLVGLLRGQGIRVGYFSDYPVAAKVAALGLQAGAELCLCAQEPDVNAYKPWPDGFLRACAVWGLDPGEVLYVGDRPDVDAVGAAAAGMRCAIVGPFRRSTRGGGTGFFRARDFRDLQRLVEELI